MKFEPGDFVWPNQSNINASCTSSSFAIAAKPLYTAYYKRFDKVSEFFKLPGRLVHFQSIEAIFRAPV